ncbi:translation initiation factor IF-2-like [Equus quagga]|uniref:translation initiation factor IF-2-like n=1 Tax=Equus quagga TaxID=89248 RepID=UPI001EE39C2E|nr:translation initiation factor IF-2-like [Equus quagga]
MEEALWVSSERQVELGTPRVDCGGEVLNEVLVTPVSLVRSNGQGPGPPALAQAAPHAVTAPLAGPRPPRRATAKLPRPLRHSAGSPRPPPRSAALGAAPQPPGSLRPHEVRTNAAPRQRRRPASAAAALGTAGFSGPRAGPGGCRPSTEGAGSGPGAGPLGPQPARPRHQGTQVTGSMDRWARASRPPPLGHWLPWWRAGCPLGLPARAPEDESAGHAGRRPRRRGGPDSRPQGSRNTRDPVPPRLAPGSHSPSPAEGLPNPQGLSCPTPPPGTAEGPPAAQRFGGGRGEKQSPCARKGTPDSVLITCFHAAYPQMPRFHSSGQQSLPPALRLPQSHCPLRGGGSNRCV